VRCGGRAVHLAPRALRAAHDAGESRVARGAMDY
jgi:hypothetical protein